MKINAIDITAKYFAYDGCHKIYLIETDEDKYESSDCGYDIHPISKLKETYESSCGLQFISNWQLTKDYVKQFERADFQE
jgi:hypothetical protein